METPFNFLVKGKMFSQGLKIGGKLGERMDGWGRQADFHMNRVYEFNQETVQASRLGKKFWLWWHSFRASRHARAVLWYDKKGGFDLYRRSSWQLEALASACGGPASLITSNRKVAKACVQAALDSCHVDHLRGRILPNVFAQLILHWAEIEASAGKNFEELRSYYDEVLRLEPTIVEWVGEKSAKGFLCQIFSKAGNFFVLHSHTPQEQTRGYELLKKASVLSEFS